ncbi:MAG: PaaI family thioesterase [Actinomycetota bacterium]|nr:PaaI family thioesterase [Actinomycetota bacterium]
MSNVKHEFETSPFHVFLALEFESEEPGTAEVRMPFREELVSDPDVPYLHGGVIASLLDIAGDYAIATKLGRGVPTIDMRVDFLKTAGREPLVARARVVRLGRSVGVADAEVVNESAEVLALGRILYSTREA